MRAVREAMRPVQGLAGPVRLPPLWQGELLLRAGLCEASVRQAVRTGLREAGVRQAVRTGLCEAGVRQAVRAGLCEAGMRQAVRAGLREAVPGFALPALPSGVREALRQACLLCQAGV
jgi:hypothetical protein